MAEPYLGEIRMFAGNYPPRNWTYCDGQLLSIKDYNALFSLLGTQFGGDGRQTFGLPDLRGRVPVHSGTGPGLKPRIQGQKMGAEDVALTANQLPEHNHPMQVSIQQGSTDDLYGAVLAESGVVTYNAPAKDETGIAPLNASAEGSEGGDTKHYNMMPYLGMRFIISLIGVYPSRN
ncbi:phage tail protein [Motilimonas sp. KMU-193]|uniref:phage tail protein n=1 Tax=Motilimonas sp. KMU-193 TaxID=3388668 RepID=UPI00396B2E8B